MKNITLLALSGSLRSASYNTAAIKALKSLAPAHIKIVIGSIAQLPLFNPDLEGQHIPALDELVSTLKHADGLIIASPEYAHGISGPMKNALDWLVGGIELPFKPIMLINTSPRAQHAQEALLEVLTTMSGNIVKGACVSIPLLSSELDSDGIIGDKEISETLLSGLEEFRFAIEDQRSA
tara:strand:- start:2 stop:541 length:540 start_codon:yes stop_codon:yes gene_type:complete